MYLIHDLRCHGLLILRIALEIVQVSLIEYNSRPPEQKKQLSTLKKITFDNHIPTVRHHLIQNRFET